MKSRWVNTSNFGTFFWIQTRSKTGQNCEKFSSHNMSSPMQIIMCSLESWVENQTILWWQFNPSHTLWPVVDTIIRFRRVTASNAITTSFILLPMMPYMSLFTDKRGILAALVNNGTVLMLTLGRDHYRWYRSIIYWISRQL